MDLSFLLQCFSDTLQADPGVRQHAESQLRTLNTTPGFLRGCLEILQQDQELPIELKKASAVYFKNKIIKNWAITDTNNSLFIKEEEKELIKLKLLDIITANEYNIKRQLIPVLKLLVSYEFPQSWSSLLSDTGILLQAVPSNLADEEFNNLYTGLLSFSEICRKFRWIKNDEREKELDPIIDQSFYFLLNIGNYLAENGEYLTEFLAEILKLILKIFKFVTYFDLPKALQSEEVFSPWGQFHGNVINMKLPPYISSYESESEKDLLQISKCLKWSLANLVRLLKRYTTSKFNYDAFKTNFIGNFLPYLVKNLLKIVESWCVGEKWLNLSSLYHLLEILNHSINFKNIWQIVRPLFEHLLKFFIYPLVIPSKHNVETFDIDPHEYIQLNFNYMIEEFNSPDIAAINLLNKFIEKKRNHSLDITSKFICEELMALLVEEETLEMARKKEGLLRITGSIVHFFLIPQSSKYYEQMEAFLMDLIIPNFNSRYKFLQARTFEIASKFSDLNIEKEEHLDLIIYHILKNFKEDTPEDSLVIRLQNALAIQAYLHLPKFRESLSLIILPVMSQLLDISNEIDSDTISVVMQECIENFSEQLQPFGIELMNKLVDNFLKLLNEIEELEKADENELSDHSEKIIAAIGLLNTMITVLMSFENNRGIIESLTIIVLPVIKVILHKKVDDYFSEVSEIIENLISLNKIVKIELWESFKLIYETFENGIGVMYFEEFLPCLKSFLIFGKQTITENKELSMMYLKIFQLMGKENESEENHNDLIYNFELMQYFILVLQIDSVSCLPLIGKEISKFFGSVEQSNNLLYKLSFNNVVISSVIYDSNLTIMIFSNQFNLFLNNWFSSIPKLTRVYDIKLSILGLITLINNNNLNLNGFLVDKFRGSLIHLLKVLPNSIAELQRRRKTFNQQEFLLNYDGNVGDFEDVVESDDNTHTQNEIYEEFSDDDTNDYIKFLTEEDYKLDNRTQEIVEDPLEITPLDNVDLNEIVNNFLQLLKINNVDKFNLLFGNLSPENQAVFSKFRWNGSGLESDIF